MRRVFVVDPETERLYEDWLGNLMRAEEKDVLNLVQVEAPHYGENFDHEKFTLALQLRQQGYKRLGDERVIQLIRRRRTAPASGGNAPSAQQSSHSLNAEVTEVAERARRRQVVVNPILEQKRWRPGRLATEAGVGKNSVYEYLDGTRARITDANREAIAQALDLKPEQLPD